MRQYPYSLLLITGKIKALTGLQDELTAGGFSCSIVPYSDEIIEHISGQAPDAILIEFNGYLPPADMQQLISGIKETNSSPVLALLANGILDGIDSSTNIDDFITGPYNIGELTARIKRLLHKTGDTEETEFIRCNGLKIDLARCEVTLDGKIIELTFKEYELLKFLAGNPGRVHTREALLDRVWGFDYYGGDRTVDVHIRRLRSKIDNPKHEYIETVRNIGYRFKKDI